MNSKLRRFEVLLPARLNDGTDVSDEVLGEAVKEQAGVYGGRLPVHALVATSER